MDMLTVAQLVERSGVPKATVYRWATEWEAKRIGPRPWRLAPRHIRYRSDDVDAWLASGGRD